MDGGLAEDQEKDMTRDDAEKIATEMVAVWPKAAARQRAITDALIRAYNAGVGEAAGGTIMNDHIWQRFLIPEAA